MIMISLMHAGARKKDFVIRPSVITFIRVFVSCGNFLFCLSFVVKEKKKACQQIFFIIVYIDGHTHTRTVRQTDRKIDSKNPE